jgi:flagellar FliL protein
MATQPQPADQAAARKKRGKLFLIAALLLVLVGGGAGAWYYLRVYDHDAAKPVKPAVFLPLESFTVNLISDDTQPQPQYLQAGLTLKLVDADQSGLIKNRMPEIRNRILMVLSSKKVKELLSVDGKRKLALEIADAVKDIIAPGSVKAAAAASAEAANAAASAAPAPVVGEAQAAQVAESPAAEPAQVAQSIAAAPAVESAPRAVPPAPGLEVLFTSFIVQ